MEPQQLDLPPTLAPQETAPFGSWKRLREEGFQETAFGQCAIRTGISWIAGMSLGTSIEFVHGVNSPELLLRRRLSDGIGVCLPLPTPRHDTAEPARQHEAQREACAGAHSICVKFYVLTA